MKANEINSKRDFLWQYSPRQLQLIERAFILGVMRRSRQVPHYQKRNSKSNKPTDESIKESDQNFHHLNFSYRNILCQEILQYGIEVNFSSNDE